MRKLCILLFILIGLHLYGQRAAPLVGNSSVDRSSVLFDIGPGNDGLWFDEMTVDEINGISNPTEGLLASDSTNHCLKIFHDSKWHCIWNGQHSVPVMSTEAIDSLQGAQEGQAVFDSDANCMKIYTGRHWQCSNSPAGGPWFSKDLYPVGGIVSAQGELLQGSGIQRVTRESTGTYVVIIKSGQQYRSTSINTIDSPNNLDRVTILGDETGGFTYKVVDSSGEAVDRAVVFTALAKGITVSDSAAVLPTSAAALYPLGCIVSRDGTPSSTCKGLSIRRVSAGVYNVTLDHHAMLASITANIYGTGVQAMDGVHFSEQNGVVQYKTGDNNGVPADRPVVLSAMVYYPAGFAPERPDNRYMMYGDIFYNSNITRGRGFSVTHQSNTGVYTVSFSGIHSIISVTANAVGRRGDLRDKVLIEQIDGTSFRYKGEDPNGAAKDLSIEFSAIVK